MGEQRAPYDAKLEVRCYKRERSRLRQEAETRGVSASELVRSQLGGLLGASSEVEKPESTADVVERAAEEARARGMSPPVAEHAEAFLRDVEAGYAPRPGGESLPPGDSLEVDGNSLVEWVAERTGAPRSIVRRQIAAGRVELDGEACSNPCENMDVSNVRLVTLDGEPV